jgi:hypothetical protein
MEIWVMSRSPTKLVVGLTVVMHGGHMKIILLHHLIDKGSTIEDEPVFRHGFGFINPSENLVGFFQL